MFQWAGGGGAGHIAEGRLLVPESGKISVTIGRSELAGSRAVLTHIPSLIVAPGRPGEPEQMWGGGGGGVIVKNEPEWIDQRCGEGYGAGGGGGEQLGADGVVIFFVTS